MLAWQNLVKKAGWLRRPRPCRRRRRLAAAVPKRVGALGPGSDRVRKRRPGCDQGRERARRWCCEALRRRARVHPGAKQPCGRQQRVRCRAGRQDGGGCDGERGHRGRRGRRRRQCAGGHLQGRRRCVAREPGAGGRRRRRGVRAGGRQACAPGAHGRRADRRAFRGAVIQPGAARRPAPPAPAPGSAAGGSERSPHPTSRPHARICASWCPAVQVVLCSPAALRA